MRALIIDNEDFQEFKEFVESHVVTRSELLKIAVGEASPPGDRPEYTRHLHMGYKVVFTVEEQNKGLARHLSVSVDTPDALPGVFAVQMIMDELGFQGNISAPDFEKVYVQVQTPKGDSPGYVEVIEYI